MPEDKREERKLKELCFRTITKWSVNEMIPFEQIQPFKRLAHIFDTEIQKIIDDKINKFLKHCGKKKAQHKCSTCVVLADLKQELYA